MSGHFRFPVIGQKGKYYCCCGDCPNCPNASAWMLTVADCAYVSGQTDGQVYCPCLNGSYLLEPSTNPTDPPCTWTLCEQWQNQQTQNGFPMCFPGSASRACESEPPFTSYGQRTWTLQLVRAGTNHDLWQWILTVDQEAWELHASCSDAFANDLMHSSTNFWTSTPQTAAPLCTGTSSWNSRAANGSATSINDSPCFSSSGNFTCNMPSFTIAPAS